MKKLNLVFVFLLFSLSLAGCDFLEPADVDVSDFTFEITEDMNVNDVVDKISGFIDSDIDYCEALIDSSTVLYDECKKGAVLPDLKGFSVSGDGEVISLTDEMVVVFLNEPSGQSYHIMISFVKVDEKIMIESLSYEKKYTYTDDQVNEAIVSMIEAYYDFNMSKIDYCDTYTDETTLVNCLEDRVDYAEELGYTVRITDQTKVDTNVYKVESLVLKDLLVIEVRTDYIKVVQGETLEVFFVDKDYYIPKLDTEDVKRIMGDMIVMIQSSSYDFDEFDTMYPSEKPYELEMLAKMIGKVDSTSINQVRLYNAGFIVVLDLVDNGVLNQVHLLFGFDGETNLYDIEYVDSDDYKLRYEVVFDDYIEMFNDPNVTLEELLNEFLFYNYIPEDLRVLREQGRKIISYNLSLQDGEEMTGKYDLHLEVEGEQFDYVVEFFIYEQELMFKFEEVFIAPDLRIVLSEFFTRVSQEPNFTCSDYVTDDSIMFCETYLATEVRYEYFVQHVIYGVHYNRGIVSYGLDNPNGPMASFDFIYEDGLFTFVNTPIFMNMNETYYYRMTSILNSEDLSTADKLNSLFALEDINMVKEFFESDLNDGYRFVGHTFNTEYDKTYMILDVKTSEGELVNSIYIEYQLDINTMLMSVIRIGYVDTISLDDANLYEAYFNEMIDDLLDLSMSDQEFCNYYGHLILDCKGMRNYYSTSGYNMELAGVTLDDYGRWNVKFAFSDSDTNEWKGFFEFNAVLFVTPEGVASRGGYVKFFDEFIPAEEIDYDLVNANILDFLEAMIDETVDSEEIMNAYSYGFTAYFLNHRELFLEFESVSLERDLNSVNEIIVTYVDGDGAELVVTYEIHISSNRDFTFNVDRDSIDYSEYYLTVSEIEDGLNGVTEPVDNLKRLTIDFHEHDLTGSLIDYVNAFNYTVKVMDTNLFDFVLVLVTPEGQVVTEIRYYFTKDVDLLGQLEGGYQVVSFGAPSSHSLMNDLRAFVDDVNNGHKTLDELKTRFSLEDLTMLTEETVLDISIRNSYVLDDSKMFASMLIFELEDSVVYASHYGDVYLVDSMYEYSLELIGYYYYMNEEEVATLEEARTLIIDFFDDYLDETITFDEIQATYFAGMYPPYLEYSRVKEFNSIDQIVFNEVTVVNDSDGNFVHFEALVTITSDTGESFDSDLQFVVRVLDDGTYYLEFDF